MALKICDDCGWRYPAIRSREHLAIHHYLPSWPCVLPESLPVGIEANQFPLYVVGILFNGIFTIQPVREVGGGCLLIAGFL